MTTDQSHLNILLINPWITDFAAFDFWSRPLGLLYVGAFLKARGHSVRLVDCLDRFHDTDGNADNERKYNTGKFHREVIDKPDCLKHVPRHYNRYGVPPGRFDELVMNGPRPDVVLVTSVMTYWYQGAFEAVARVRRLLPDVPVILGGIYAMLCPEHAARHSGADFVVTSSSPSQIVYSIESAAGIYRDTDTIDDTFGGWPEPLWSLYPRLAAATVMTARGCPMHCTVCASRILFDGFERRDPGDAAREILGLAKRGVEDIAFADDALLLNADKYAFPLFEAIAAAGSPLRLHTPNGLHVREITPALARLMRRAGVVTVRLSLETASESRHSDFSGKVSREEFRAASDALYAAGFAPHELGAYILAGLPGQTLEEVEDTAAFAHDCRVPVRPALFSPVPGTVEFGRAVVAGVIRSDDDPLLHNNSLRASDWFDGGEAGYRAFKKRLDAGNMRITG